ncbi:MAG: nitrile hydratase subunit beta [Rhodobacteraceae bacterium]|nr:nitrile hydratase subunit beta [Paracoccaceae bacterium]
MTRVHDMGGRYGDGPVRPEPQGVPAFAADWHPRALALTVAAGGLGKWNIDMARHAREALAPRDYNRFAYYEKWIAALADMLVSEGLVSRAELTDGQGAAPGPEGPAAGPVTVQKVRQMIANGAPADRAASAPARFVPGDRVRTRRPAANLFVDGGHTRLPQYAAGAEGRVLRVHGSHVLPDRSAHKLGEGAEPLYAVAFAASALWARPEHPRDEVVLDLWQSYLEAV